MGMELVRWISDQGLQKRILRERNPMLQEMISIATWWQLAEDAMAQVIVNIKSSKTGSEPEEAKDEVPNWNKGPVTSNLDYTRDQKEREESTHMDSN